LINTAATAAAAAATAAAVAVAEEVRRARRQGVWARRGGRAPPVGGAALSQAVARGERRRAEKQRPAGRAAAVRDVAMVAARGAVSNVVTTKTSALWSPM